jgi:lipase chaperone LimK
MDAATPCEPGPLDWAFGMLAQAVSWKSACVMLSALVLTGLLRLLSEWQRRQTLVDLVERAPGGTVVI